jgi:tRNA(adenine34) deaminase
MKNFMEAALEEARKAMAMGEVPVGAVVVKDGQILGRGHNLTESSKDPTAHAEMIAIREAAAALGGWRLMGCTLYVTVEPCAMCAGALVWSRMEKLTIGTMDPKSGACGSIYNIPADNRLNHQVQVETGILREECEGLMKEFFRKLRNQK